MQFGPQPAGHPGEEEHHDEVSDAPPRIPLSVAWITEELIDETRRVWSPEYGHVLSAEEAIEILINVKRLAEVFIKTEKENGVWIS